MAIKDLKFSLQALIFGCSKLLFAKMVILTVAFCHPLQVVGQDDLENGNPLINTEVTAIQNAPIRTHPPKEYLYFFNKPGEEISKTKSKETYVISEYKTLPYSFTHQTWVKVRPASMASFAGNCDNCGWVYWGEEISSGSVNFEQNN